MFNFLLKLDAIIFSSKSFDKSVLPRTECLKDTVERFLPFWHDTVVPQLKNGKKVLIAAHGNSIRALVKYLDKVPDNEIVELNIPTVNYFMIEKSRKKIFKLNSI